MLVKDLPPRWLPLRMTLPRRTRSIMIYLDLNSFSTKLEIDFRNSMFFPCIFAAPFVFGRTWSDCSTKLLEIKMEPFPSKHAEMWKDEMMLQCDATNVSLTNANCWGDDIRDVQGSLCKRCQHFQKQLLRTRRTRCCKNTEQAHHISIVRGSSAAWGVLDGLGHCSSRLQLRQWSLHVKRFSLRLDRCSWKDWMEGGMVCEWWRLFFFERKLW